MFKFVSDRAKGGGWANFGPRLPQSRAVVVPITIRSDNVFPHRRAA